ncbi:hypothetical protein [Pseudomarimonas arenosa]|uniref:Uncharacterized protein n=1 Tax=Pseudomarimonas arenosa TaxID=2774145 RepID=A0AAW3ZNS0_9GAMM|nr:hypothetical protein [Pseudomarimonas arenosa]MBD8527378.1 hypothetical protein [Pseudomarimonas arenosa]
MSKRLVQLSCVAVVATSAAFYLSRSQELEVELAVLNADQGRSLIVEKASRMADQSASASAALSSGGTRWVADSMAAIQSAKPDSPSGMLDQRELLRHGTDICNFFAVSAGTGSTSMVDFVMRTSDSQVLSDEHLRSAALVDRFRQRFCSSGLDVEEVTASSLESLRADLLEADLAIILDAMDLSEGADESTVLAVRDGLTEVLSTTDSPTAFFLAAESFVGESPLARSFPPEGFRPIFRDPVHPSTYRQVGNMLAYCRLTPVTCEPGSLAVILSCFPSNCREGESVFGYYSRTVSPQVLNDAQRYAEYLLSLRRS